LRATRAIHRAEAAWEALRTAKHWAAHHQWIEAVDDARRAIGAWAAAAKAHLGLESDATLADFRMEGQGGVPDDRPIPPCDSTAPRLAATELEETYQSRRAVASVTLSAAGGVNGELRRAGCSDLLARLKAEVRGAQLRAHRVVNTELLGLYWAIGKAIVDLQSAEVSAADVDDAIAIGDELIKTLTPAIDQLLRPPS
jgi:hypothetical protein